VICLQILRAVTRRAVAIVIVIVVVVIIVVVARRAIAIIVDFVARHAVAIVVVVGCRRHRVPLSPVAPSSAYVGYLSSTLFFLLTCIFVHCPYTSLCFSMYSF
jgi:hypothetical protein